MVPASSHNPGGRKSPVGPNGIFYTHLFSLDQYHSLFTRKSSDARAGRSLGHRAGRSRAILANAWTTLMALGWGKASYKDGGPS